MQRVRRILTLPDDAEDRHWRCSVRRGLQTEVVHGTLWACMQFALRALVDNSGSRNVDSFEIARNISQRNYPEG